MSTLCAHPYSIVDYRLDLDHIGYVEDLIIYDEKRRKESPHFIHHVVLYVGVHGLSFVPIHPSWDFKSSIYIILF